MGTLSSTRMLRRRPGSAIQFFFSASAGRVTAISLQPTEARYGRQWDSGASLFQTVNTGEQRYIRKGEGVARTRGSDKAKSFVLVLSPLRPYRDANPRPHRANRRLSTTGRQPG